MKIILTENEVKEILRQHYKSLPNAEFKIVSSEKISNYTNGLISSIEQIEEKNRERHEVTTDRTVETQVNNFKAFIQEPREVGIQKIKDYFGLSLVEATAAYNHRFEAEGFLRQHNSLRGFWRYLLA